jgi:hypothetical protein
VHCKEERIDHVQVKVVSEKFVIVKVKQLVNGKHQSQIKNQLLSKCINLMFCLEVSVFISSIKISLHKLTQSNSTTQLSQDQIVQMEKRHINMRNRLMNISTLLNSAQSQC